MAPIAVHLADRGLTPLFSSSSSLSPHGHATTTADPSHEPTPPRRQLQSQALSALTAQALTAYDSALRLGLGAPQRIMIETTAGGPMLLHSYIHPDQTAAMTTQERHESSSAGAGASGDGARPVGEVRRRDILQQARNDLRPLDGGRSANASGAGSLSQSQELGLTNGSHMSGSGFINGHTAPGQEGSLSSAMGSTTDVNGEPELDNMGEDETIDDNEDDDDDEALKLPPLLVASVVTPSASEVIDARRAAARLERMGRDFQYAWAREQEEVRLARGF